MVRKCAKSFMQSIRKISRKKIEHLSMRGRLKSGDINHEKENFLCTFCFSCLLLRTN